MKSDFEQWAIQYSGGDGGNIDGNIWLFGIEYGAPKDRKERFSFDDSSSPSEWPSENQDDYLSYFNQHNTKAIKLLTVLANQPLNEYKSYAWSNRIFCSQSNYFKFNLFPLPFKTISVAEWDSVWISRTGFNSKPEYTDWCRKYRFPVIKSWFDKHNPELVIANGLTFRDDFCSAFGYDQNSIQKHELSPEIIVYTIEKLVVIPFLGRPLNSNAKINLVGEFLRNYKNSLTKN